MAHTLTPAHPPGSPVLPSGLRMGPIELAVSDLDRSVGWYQSALGLRVHAHEPARAELGDGRIACLHLIEQPAARPPGRHAGLYHYALLYPSRHALADAALRLAETRTPIQGASDHGTHEAIYLPDPDGLGIELAADRPAAQWPSPEQEFGRGGPLPLDTDSLLAAAQAAAGAPVAEGLRIGHVHLHVGDIERGLAFYRDLVGFEVWALLPTAAFVSAGGYHHHLGFNVWLGRGVGPAPPGTAGLRHWSIDLPPADAASLRERLAAAGAALTASDGGYTVRDPWDVALRVRTGGQSADPAAAR